MRRPSGRLHRIARSYGIARRIGGRRARLGGDGAAAPAAGLRSQLSGLYAVGRELDPDQVFFLADECRAMQRAQEHATSMRTRMALRSGRECVVWDPLRNVCQQTEPLPGTRPSAVVLDEFAELYFSEMLRPAQQEQVRRSGKIRKAFRLWTELVFEMFRRDLPTLSEPLQTPLETYRDAAEREDATARRLFGDPSEVGLQKADAELNRLIERDGRAETADRNLMTRLYLESISDPDTDSLLRYIDLLAALNIQRLRANNEAHAKEVAEQRRIKGDFLPPLPTPPPLPPLPPGRRPIIPPKLPPIPPPKPAFLPTNPVPRTTVNPAARTTANPALRASAKAGSPGTAQRSTVRAAKSFRAASRSQEVLRRESVRQGERSPSPQGLSTPIAARPIVQPAPMAEGAPMASVMVNNPSFVPMYVRVYKIKEPVSCKEPCPIEEYLGSRSAIHVVAARQKGLVTYQPLSFFERARPGQTLRLLWAPSATSLITDRPYEANVRHLRLRPSSSSVDLQESL